MNTIRPTRTAGALALAALVAAAACDLEQRNPNAPVQEASLAEPEGVVALAVGMQGQFSAEIEDFIVPASLVTDEWGTTTRALASYQVLLTGEGISASFGTVEATWFSMYRVIRSADLIVDHAGEVGFGPGLVTGLTALARLYKGMAFGWLAETYVAAPIDVSGENPVPVPREQVLAEAIRQLEAARAELGTVSDADLGPFRDRVLGAGFDIRNVVEAMLARYYLVAGQPAQALEAARRVDLSVTPVFTYTGTTTNPVTSITTTGLRYTAPLRSFVTQAEPGDARPDFWVRTDAATFVGNPDSVLQPNRRYTDPAEPFPVYLPDEIRLVMAEAQARLGDLDAARALINEVRTRPSSGPLDPAAGLPALPAGELATAEAVLAQIAYERRYELYMTGLRWGDTRRLSPFTATDPTIEFFPIPLSECDRNPGAGC